DFTRNVGVAKHSTVDFLGVPIAYSPWMDFSLDGSRKSGLLPPTFGSTSNSGVELTLPFYWNIAPNYDWEIAPRMMSKRGVAFNNLFRYLQPGAGGEIRAEWLPSDRITDTNRYTGELKHTQVFSPNWSGTLQLQKVSDDNYFTDLSNRVSSTSLVNLPRIGTLTYAQPDWSLTGRVERYQTLQDPLAPVVAPYFREPQLLFNGHKLGPGDSEMAMVGEYVSFGHPTLVNGKRSMLYPNVALPLQTTYAYITPKVGYSYTHYDMAANPATSADKTTYSRGLPIVSVDSSLFLERDDSWFGNAFTQTLEPRLYYLYIPYRDQSMLPNFDSSEMDLNFAQLFSENQFAGYDRINNANQVTAALTSRILENASGRERLRFSLGQRYYFADQKVTLNNPVRKSNSSDLLLGLGGQLSNSVSLDGNWQYNQSDANSERFNVDLRYRPELGKALNLSYRFERQMYRQVDVSGQWPLFRNWWGVGRMAYSLSDRKTLEALAGLEYNAGCWMVRMGGQRFVTDVDKMSSGYLIQLELTDIARVGTNALEVLSRAIPGYGKITVDRPVRSSEIYR
ncbi:MAG: LPS assembly protein LptD, partial [Chitinivorax sp.]